jgi:hypothetical protein
MVTSSVSAASFARDDLWWAAGKNGEMEGEMVGRVMLDTAFLLCVFAVG